METKYTLKQSTRGTGNPGMKTPYEQGYESGRQGLLFEQIYDQPGEETEAKEFCNGWNDWTYGISEGFRG